MFSKLEAFVTAAVVSSLISALNAGNNNYFKPTSTSVLASPALGGERLTKTKGENLFNTSEKCEPGKTVNHRI